MMRSDARKRLTADHVIHHDPAVVALIERERRAAAVEALREFGFWLEKNIASPAAHRAAYDRADRIEAS